MKVLHLGKFYPPAKGGIESMVQLICRETTQYVQNRAIVANDRFGLTVETDGAVEVIRVPTMFKVGAVAVCPTFPLQLARFDADVVVLHEPNPMALLAYFIVRPDANLIVWFHSEVIRPSWRYRLFYKPFQQFAFARAHRIVVSSPAMAATAAELQRWRDKCVVIPYGADTSKSGNTSTTAARAQRIREEIGRPIVLFVGRLVPYKGVEVLLDAMCTTPAAALLVGAGHLRPALERKAGALGISHRVRFAGEVSDAELAAMYEACDLLALPSITRQEAFGVVQLEAMARGKPVVSTNLGTGVSWVNVHEQTGLVVPPGDARALQQALVRLLSDRVERHRMGAAAQDRVRLLFSVKAMVNAVVGLYHQSIGSDVGRKTVA